jgi:hypothetical protein
MNVKIRAEVAQFLEKEYINGIAVAVCVFGKKLKKALYKPNYFEDFTCSFSFADLFQKICQIQPLVILRLWFSLLREYALGEKQT